MLFYKFYVNMFVYNGLLYLSPHPPLLKGEGETEENHSVSTALKYRAIGFNLLPAFLPFDSTGMTPLSGASALIRIICVHLRANKLHSSQFTLKT